MPNWIWVRRGTSRSCVGCHENKELAPENRVSQALARLQETALLATPEQRRTVTFQKDIYPILQARCVSCHSGGSPAGRLDLASGNAGHTGAVYSKLTASRYAGAAEPGEPYVTPGSARKSRLIEVLLGKTANPAKPHPAVLRDAEKKALIEWIDLGAQPAD